MDAETAMDLVKKGATLLLLNVPQRTLIGVDTQVFLAGPKFCGIKMIPPGPHFIYYSATDRSGNTFSPVTGFFVDASTSEVIVRKWNETEEKLVKILEDEEERYCMAVKKFEFDQQLGPYALEHFREWKQLSGYINKDVIERIVPVGGEISILYESELLYTNPKTTMEKRLLEQLKHDGKFHISVEKSCKRCYYTSIPPVLKRKGISGEELTAINLDKTKLLESIILNDFGGTEDMLLGELQFAFIAFLMGQSLEAFFQWKALVTLLLGCTDAPFHTRSKLFVKFVKVLYFHLKHGFCKEDQSATSTERGATVLLDDSWLLSMNNFLHHLCKEFFSMIEEATVVDGDLLAWVCQKVFSVLQRIFPFVTFIAHKRIHLVGNL
ncbi:unnamed protein product [Victoria cruziana]